MNKVKQEYEKYQALKHSFNMKYKGILTEQEQRKKYKLVKEFNEYYINIEYPINITPEQFKK